MTIILIIIIKYFIHRNIKNMHDAKMRTQICINTNDKIRTHSVDACVQLGYGAYIRPLWLVCL